MQYLKHLISIARESSYHRLCLRRPANDPKYWPIRKKQKNVWYPRRNLCENWQSTSVSSWPNQLHRSNSNLHKSDCANSQQHLSILSRKCIHGYSVFFVNRETGNKRNSIGVFACPLLLAVGYLGLTGWGILARRNNWLAWKLRSNL